MNYYTVNILASTVSVSILRYCVHIQFRIVVKIIAKRERGEREGERERRGTEGPREREEGGDREIERSRC